jgi:hypothetical protein
LARLAFGVHALLALGLLGWGLSESSHSDGKIPMYVLFVEACGILSLAAASHAASYPKRAAAT